MSETLRVELVVREDDGKTIVKTLEGEAAAKWSEMVASVCQLAELRDQNPPWSSLKWKKRELGVE